MPITTNNDLDPVMETLGLLYFSNHPGWKEDVIQSLNEYGIAGELFYQKHFKIVEKYLKTFEKHKVSFPQESFFFQSDDDTTLHLLFTMAVEHRRYLHDRSHMNPMELRSFLAYYITDTDSAPSIPPVSEMPQLPDEKSMLEFLDSVDIKSEEKWYVLDLLRRPEYWFCQLMDMILANLPAFEAAKQAVLTPLQKLLAQNADFQDALFHKITDAYSDISTVYMSLILPLVQMFLYTCAYQGLFNKYLAQEAGNANTSKEALLRQLKAMSEKSKLDILCALKQSNMYNLELSEKLHLSPSTMSHHMTALLSCGLVTVEKQNGKVYYCLDKKNIALFFENLQKLML